MSEAVTALDQKLRAAGIPLDGVSPLPDGGWRVDLRPEATQQQIDQAAAIVADFDGSPAALDTWLTVQTRERAKAALDRQRSELEALLRAVVLALVSELNTLRTRQRAQDAAIAGAGSLAALKSAWAALAPMPDRTGGQARTAIAALLDAGSADA